MMEFVIKSILPLPFEYCEYNDGIKLKDLCNLYKEFCSKPDRWFLCDMHAKLTELCKGTAESFCWWILSYPFLWIVLKLMWMVSDYLWSMGQEWLRTPCDYILQCVHRDHLLGCWVFIIKSALTITCNLSIWEVKVGEPEVQSHP